VVKIHVDTRGRVEDTRGVGKECRHVDQSIREEARGIVRSAGSPSSSTNERKAEAVENEKDVGPAGVEEGVLRSRNEGREERRSLTVVSRKREKESTLTLLGTDQRRVVRYGGRAVLYSTYGDLDPSTENEMVVR